MDLLCDDTRRGGWGAFQHFILQHEYPDQSHGTRNFEMNRNSLILSRIQSNILQILQPDPISVSIPDPYPALWLPFSK